MSERRRRERGFTLLEVLVALAILGVGLAGFYRTFGGGLLAVGVAERQRQAVLFVDDLVAELGRSKPVVDGETTGVLADGQPWRVRIVAYSTRDFGREPPRVRLHLVRIDIGGRAYRFNTLIAAPP